MQVVRAHRKRRHRNAMTSHMLWSELFMAWTWSEPTIAWPIDLLIDLHSESVSFHSTFDSPEFGGGKDHNSLFVPVYLVSPPSSTTSCLDFVALLPDISDHLAERMLSHDFCWFSLVLLDFLLIEIKLNKAVNAALEHLSPRFRPKPTIPKFHDVSERDFCFVGGDLTLGGTKKRDQSLVKSCGLLLCGASSLLA